jgi:ribosomal protein S18 acetylase RimI-like enzyme
MARQRPTEPIPWASVRPATAGDLVSMSSMRADDVPEGLLRTLGSSAWRAVLAEFVRDPASILLVATKDDGVKGYSLATTRSAAVQRRALARSPALWLAALRSAMKHPGSIAPIFRRVAHLIRPARQAARSTEPALRLLDIVVASDARGAGLGRTLLQSTLDAAAAMGHTEIGLSVLADNAAGIGLYERTGFLASGRGTRADGRSYLTMRRSI